MSNAEYVPPRTRVYRALGEMAVDNKLHVDDAAWLLSLLDRIIEANAQIDGGEA